MSLQLRYNLFISFPVLQDASGVRIWQGVRIETLPQTHNNGVSLLHDGYLDVCCCYHSNKKGNIRDGASTDCKCKSSFVFKIEILSPTLYLFVTLTINSPLSTSTMSNGPLSTSLPVGSLVVSRYAPNGVSGGFNSLPSQFVGIIHPTSHVPGLSGGMQSLDHLYNNLGGASKCGSIKKIFERTSHCTTQGHVPYDWRDSKV